MNFDLNEEQQLVQDSIQRFVQDNYALEDRQAVVASKDDFNQTHWATMAELGWLGLTIPEADGGFGGNQADTMVIMEQFGKGLVLEPYLASVILAGGALKIAGSAAQKETLLAGLIDGSRQAALAFAEPQGRFNLADLTTSASESGDGYLLNGHKSVVLNGPAADFFVVTARTAGAQRDTEGVSLFIVPADAAGVSRRDYPTVDAFRASEVTFDNVALAADALLGEPGAGFAVVEQVIDEATLAVGSEAVGCMEVLYKATVEYCKTREQFGQPIGKFQVLQHRMVDMFMEHEQSKSLMYLAAMRLDEGYDDEARKAVSAFKVQVGKSGRFVAQGAVQLHGGMGMTDELSVGHYFKRLTMIDTLFGNVDHHLNRFAAL